MVDFPIRMEPTRRWQPRTENRAPLGGKYGAKKAPPRATERWKSYYVAGEYSP